MNEMTSAAFVAALPTLTEPTRVRRYKAVLGDWYPGGHQCGPFLDAATVQELQDRDEEIARLKRELAKRDEAPTPTPSPITGLIDYVTGREPTPVAPEAHTAVTATRQRQKNIDQVLHSAFPQRKGRP